MPNQQDPQRQELEEEYATWAQICLDKHGLPYPIGKDRLPQASNQELMMELKKLKVLGRTPHE